MGANPCVQVPTWAGKTDTRRVEAVRAAHKTHVHVSTYFWPYIVYHPDKYAGAVLLQRGVGFRGGWTHLHLSQLMCRLLSVVFTLMRLLWPQFVIIHNVVTSCKILSIWCMIWCDAESTCYYMKKTNQGDTKACLICPSSADTARALGLLEEYCTKLRKPEEQQLKTAIQRVMGIFQSNLFEALLGKSV